MAFLRPARRPTDPDECVFEDGHDAAVDGVAHVLHRAAAPHDDGVAEVRVLARLLSVDPDERQHLPHGEQQVVQVQLHVTAAAPGAGGGGGGDRLDHRPTTEQWRGAAIYEPSQQITIFFGVGNATYKRLKWMLVYISGRL